MKPVILTGIRSNADLTLGNYLGAMLPLINIQKAHDQDFQINMFIPDLHSFITPIDHSTLYQRTIDNLVAMVASGLNIDTPSSYIYRQSFIPAHSELTWILDCFTHVGELNRMTQYKDKSLHSPIVNAGLFNYPVLMAADILLYDALYVPVGEDQRQHLELTRNIAMRINKQFNQKLFTIPASWERQVRFNEHGTSGLRIRNLRHPELKMSKSIADPNGTILLTDDPKQAFKKIMSATTDSKNKINYDFKNQPGISNLLQILAMLKNTSIEQTTKEWSSKTSYTDLKQITAESVEHFLENYQNNITKVNVDKIMAKLNKDEKLINKIANKKLNLVQKVIGLRS